MVRSPVVGMISTLMWSFNSASQAYLQVRGGTSPEPGHRINSAQARHGANPAWMTY